MRTILTSLLSLFAFCMVYSQEYAQKRLEESPRHHEWVPVQYGERTVHCFVAYPESQSSTLAVLVLHENRGLNDWARSVADQFAEAGYLAIAPDLLSNCQPGIEKTSDFESADKAREAIYALDPGQVTADLDAVFAHIRKDPSCTGKVVVAGFCWGGAQSFRYATNNPDLAAAMVFYGSAPEEPEAIDRIQAPVYGFYGENDQRINARIPETEAMAQQAGKVYDYKIYPGAGHAYMRQGDDPNGSAENRQARDDSWTRIKEILDGIK